MIPRALPLTFALFLELTASAAASPALPSVRTSAECTNKDETALLHHRLTMPSLSVWEGPRQQWRSLLPKEGPPTNVKIRVIHLWGTWCGPCKDEFPVIKQMDLQIRRNYQGAVQFVYIADSLSTNAAMKTFIEKYHDDMPTGLLYHDDENKLAMDLLAVLPQGSAVEGRNESPNERQLNLPITLLVDADDVVRQAFVGSITARRPELVNGIAQLYQALERTPPAQKSKVAAKNGGKTL